MTFKKISIDLEFFDNLVGSSSNLISHDVSAFKEALNFILEELRSADVRCEFFVTGEVIEVCPDLVSKAIAQGHVVGFHSMKHSDFRSLSYEQIVKEMDYCVACAERFAGFTKSFRAPGFRKPSNEMQHCYDEILAQREIIDHSNIRSIRLFGFNLRPGGTVFRVLPLGVFKFLFKNEMFDEIYIHPRDIHTRFYMPQTGSLYQRLIASLRFGNTKKRFRAVIKELINE